MPEGWNPSLWCGRDKAQHVLANAMRAVEVEALKTGQGYLMPKGGITARRVTLYAVEKKEEK